MERLMAVAVLALSLGACTISYKAAARYADDSERFVGDVNASMFGGGTVELVSVGSDVVCAGDAEAEGAAATCSGQRGTVAMKCSDGRVLEGEWVATSCTTGVGSGTDDSGREFEFVFGLTEEEADAFAKQ